MSIHPALRRESIDTKKERLFLSESLTEQSDRSPDPESPS